MVKAVEFLSNAFSASVEKSSVDFKWIIFVFYKVILTTEDLKNERLESGRQLLGFSMWGVRGLNPRDPGAVGGSRGNGEEGNDESSQGVKGESSPCFHTFWSFFLK